MDYFTKWADQPFHFVIRKLLLLQMLLSRCAVVLACQIYYIMIRAGTMRAPFFIKYFRHLAFRTTAYHPQGDGMVECFNHHYSYSGVIWSLKMIGNVGALRVSYCSTLPNWCLIVSAYVWEAISIITLLLTHCF